jgi:peptidoglycan/LPS O-acetylase OafA/YrhL
LSLERALPHAGARNLGLDVIRAAAILLVLTAHWSNNISAWLGITPNPRLFFSGGLGVDLFFALSGFLIGRILIAEAGREASWRNLGVFLVRRWMRTLPLYFLVLAVLLVFFPPPELPLRYALKYATLSQNLWKPMPPGWWFSVSWSLTVEEWFYLLFGCAAFASFRFFPRRWAIWPPTLLFIAAPLALRLLVPAFATNPALSPVVFFRLDAIAYGVALAQLHHQGSALFRRPLVALATGLSLIAMLWAGYVHGPRPWAQALFYDASIVGCVLLLPAALRLRTLPRGLEAAARTVSAQSYGLYLIHLTVLVQVAQALRYAHHWPLPVCLAIATVGPFVLSWLSFRYLESPILRLRPSHRRPPAAPQAEPTPLAA